MLDDVKVAVDIRKIIQHKGVDSVLKTVDFPLTEAEKIIASHCSNTRPSQNPYILHMLGIPASGKSIFIQSLNLSDAVILSFDSIMENITACQEDKTYLGSEQTFAKWEIPAREIGYEVLFRSIAAGYNIAFDHSGARADHVKMLAYIKQQYGYQVRIVAMKTDVETAFLWAKQRGKFVPPHYFAEREKVLTELLPYYRHIADTYQEITPEG